MAPQASAVNTAHPMTRPMADVPPRKLAHAPRRRQLVRLLRYGIPLSMAAAAVDVSESTIRREMRRSPRFGRLVGGAVKAGQQRARAESAERRRARARVRRWHLLPPALVIGGQVLLWASAVGMFVPAAGAFAALALLIALRQAARVFVARGASPISQEPSAAVNGTAIGSMVGPGQAGSLRWVRGTFEPMSGEQWSTWRSRRP